MKYNLKKCTFVIPIKFDSEDRHENLQIILDYLNFNFDTNIIIGEMDCIQNGKYLTKKNLNYNCNYRFFKNTENFFHRTKLLNKLYRLSNTDIVVNYDSDVLLSSKSYVDAYNLLINNEKDVVYPYNGRFLDIKREYIPNIKKCYNIDFLQKYNHVCRNGNSFGGAIFFNKKVLMQGGMENENFKAWGPEDLERYHRFLALGYRVERLRKYSLYHIIHYKGNDSSKKNPYFDDNWKEYDYVKVLDKFRLQKYISEWSWIHNGSN